MQELDYRLFNMATVGQARKKKAIKEQSIDQVRRNKDIIEKALLHYLSLSDFRKRRRRSRDYYRGKQWGDLITNPDTGETTTEEQYILSQGKLPLKQNVIRQLIKNIIGQWRANRTKSQVVARTSDDAGLSDVLTNALHAALDLNQAKRIDARSLEEFLLSGVPIQKVEYRLWPHTDTADVMLRPVPVSRFFFNSDVIDPRLTDLRLIGEIHDLTYNQIVAAFARSKSDEQRLKEFYGGITEESIINHYGLNSTRMDAVNFLIAEPGKYRVIEIWELRGEWRVYQHDWMDGTESIVKKTLKEIDLENQSRIQQAAMVGITQEDVPLIDAYQQYDEYWHVQYLTPYGDLLYENETPYWHGEHPYILDVYPMLDGEAWGFVEDVIDQQRYINRLISMIDSIIGNSAKGVLLIPEDSIPDNMTEKDFAREWTKFNGVITYKPKPGQPLPTQIAANSVNIGAADLLSIQMRLMNEISGVHGAIQGHGAKSGTPASLYAQEAQNATLNILDYMETFAEFRKKRDTKVLQVIQQFYNHRRQLIISGADYERNATEYDPDKVRNLDWSLQVAQSADSPTYRHMIDDLLMQLLQMQAIDVEMYLENSSMPFSEKMLNTIREKRQEMEQTGQMPQGGVVPPEMMQQADQAANPKALELVKRAMQV